MRREHAIAVAVLFAFTVPVFALPASDNGKIATASKTQNGIDREPPAPIYEVEPGERPGYVWTPGCWTLQRGRLVWTPGTWLAERPGYTWVPAGWEQRAGKWYYAKGYWEANNEAAEDETIATDEANEPSPPSDAAATTETTSKDTKKKLAPGKKHSRKIDYNNRQTWPAYQRN